MARSKHIPKRTPAQRSLDLLAIVAFLQEGLSPQEITDELNGDEARKYQLSVSSIYRDITEVRTGLGKLTEEQAQDMKGLELTDIQWIIRQAKGSWEKSKKGSKRTRTKKTESGRQRPQTEAMVETIDKPGDPKFLDVILKAMERRAKLLGTDSPSRHQLSGPDGGPIPVEEMDLEHAENAFSDIIQKRAGLKAKLRSSRN
tara:strand:+ start:137 stop:739 length:603 start_codon:yes stop_codon:yes gene_type:complete